MDLLVLYTILFVLALACFLVYAFNASTAKVNLLGLGLFFWTLVPFIQTLNKL